MSVAVCYCLFGARFLLVTATKPANKSFAIPTIATRCIVFITLFDNSKVTKYSPETTLTAQK